MRIELTSVVIVCVVRLLIFHGELDKIVKLLTYTEELSFCICPYADVLDIIDAIIKSHCLPTVIKNSPHMN